MKSAPTDQEGIVTKKEAIGCQQCACGYKIPGMEYMRKWYRAKLSNAYYEKIYLSMKPIIVHFSGSGEIEKIECICGRILRQIGEEQCGK